MPEQDIEELPKGDTPNSFRVLAEWLRDNRRMLEGRMDKQDRKLEEIHAETRRTNGRVTDLENSVELGTALERGHSQWEQDQKDKVTAASARHEARRDKWIDRLSTFGYVMLGVIGGSLGHALGIW